MCKECARGYEIQLWKRIAWDVSFLVVFPLVVYAAF